MGFARNWVMMVMRCISWVEFAIIVNGKAGDDFKSTRGIRQPWVTGLLERWILFKAWPLIVVGF
ncbi:unnamed protein product [Prunus armeniaca]|uniref:Uncharacterized protein n=1 Tax=Prunus armeniaca TaxID=36596 RepID=A0A6J5USY0_PRUAR|nr:unnamed protein product [Prunus armeniaca]